LKEVGWIAAAKVAASQGSGQVLGRARQAHRLVQALHEGARIPLSRARFRSSGSRTALTNVSYNCVDRHLKTHGEQYGADLGRRRPLYRQKITYNQLYDQVCRLANVLKAHGVKKGDRVTIYMPMIPEAPMRCWPARGSAPSIPWCSAASRRRPGRPHRRLPLQASLSPADEGLRGGKPVPLKANTDAAIDKVAGASMRP
jgi:acyl-coenzyme A synthetase/AMP-(fatty) acid ligase